MKRSVAALEHVAKRALRFMVWRRHQSVSQYRRRDGVESPRTEFISRS